MSQKWNRPASPPPALFVGTPEKNFQQQISNEVTEYVLKQEVIYFAVDLQKTNWHPLYKEAINKVYLAPIQCFSMLEYNDNLTVIDKFGKDRKSSIVVAFSNRRLREDKDLFIREGDLLFYNDEYHEIAKIEEPRLLYGTQEKVEYKAICTKTRCPPSFTNRG